MRRHLRALTSAPSLLLLALAACARPAPQERAAPPPGGVAVASSFTNGDFEQDPVGAAPPSGWTLQTALNSSGVSGTSSAPPTTLSALRLGGAGVEETFVVGGAAPLSQVDPDLGPGQSFRFPAYGSRAVRVNYKDAAQNGKDKNANLLRQTMSIGLHDIDPADGLVHVRFAVAPVLENPSHAYSQQPYYFVELLNLTRGTKLYGAFNVAGQAGVPWRTTTSVVTRNTTQWLDWQLVDIAPGNAALAVGDQVQLTVLASGCSLGGHFARIYVDGIGARIPGPFVWATAPGTVNAGGALAYTVTYSNGGTAATIGTHVEFTTPPQTTFTSVSGISGCTLPSAGAAGTVSCALGTLNPGASGSFTVTVGVAAAATGSVVAGTYSIGAVNAPALLGSKVTTTVIGGSTPTANLALTKTAAPTTVQAGSTAYASGTPLYTITLTNPSAYTFRSRDGRTVTLTDVVPAAVTNVSWTCTATGTAGTTSKCRDASGTGAINSSGTGNTITLSPRLGTGNGRITVQVYGTISASASGTVSNTATATVNGITDPNLANNTATASFTVGTPVTLSLTKVGGAATGVVSSAPARLTCGTSCTTTSASFAAGSEVLLTAVPQAGGTFVGWSGAGAPASCTTGAPTTCAVLMDAARSVTATFAARPAAGAPAHVYAYAGSGQLARTSTAFGAPLVALVTDANGQPVPGATVSFAAPGSGASAAVAASAATSAAGLATVPATAGGVAGTYTVEASVAGAAAPADFTLTNVGAPDSITYVNGGTLEEPQLAPTSSVFAAPLVALVRDAAGNAVPGATVTFAAPAAGATAALSSGTATGASVTATTDAGGMAGVTATASATAGAFTASASVAGVADPVRFYLQSTTPGPAAVFVVAGTPQRTAVSSPFADPLVAAVADASGNALPGVPVTFTVVPAGGATGTLNGPTSTTVTATTDAAGLASVTAAAGAVGGTFTVTARVAGVAAPGEFTLTGDGDQTLTVDAGSPQTAAFGAQFALPLRVLLLDASDEPVAGAVVTFTVPTSGATATLSSATATTDASGLASVTAVAAGAAGSYSIVASTPNAPSTAAFALTNTAAPATVTLAGGSLSTTYDGTPKAVTVTTSPAGLAVAVTYDGSATAPTHAGTYAVVATVTAPGYTGAASGTLIVARASQEVRFTPPAATYGDAPIDLALHASGGDSGNPVSFRVVSGPGVLAGTTLTLTGAGSIVVDASQEGDDDHAAAPTVRRTLAVSPGPTTTVLTAPAPSLVGQSVTFTVRVTGAGGTPTGTVAIREGAATVCTATLSGGAGSCASAALGAGSHDLTARYAGDVDHAPSTSGPATLAVAKGGAAVAVAASPTAPVSGQALTLEATVTARPPASGTPGGSVELRAGGRLLCTVTLAGGAGSCTAALGAGDHTISASYGGDGAFLAASGEGAVTVARGPSTVAVTASPTRSTAGQPVTFTASVAAAAPSTATPTGTVAFTDGATPLCAEAPITAGTATCTTSALTAGDHAVAATWGGDAELLGASGSLAHTADPAATSLALAVPPGAVRVGQSVTLTATVTGAGTPGGAVAFTDGGAVLCEAAPLSGGLATCATPALAVGDHAFEAAYAGDGTHAGSRGAAALRVQPGATTLAVSASPTPSTRGQAVTFTAHVHVTAPASATPTGAVSFTVGTTELCPAAALSGGQATCTTSGLAVGPATVTATWGGDASLTGSSGSASHTVAPTPTSTALVAGPSPAHVGQAVTLTATVAAAGGAPGAPGGTVTFTDGTTQLCPPRPLEGATAACTTSALAVGRHALAAAYSGDAGFAASDGAAALDVLAGGTTVALDVAPAEPVSGEPVTFLVTVAPAAPAQGGPGGSVDVWEGTTLLCTATVTGGAGACTAALGAGAHALSVTYGGGGPSWSDSSGTASLAVGKGRSALTVAATPAPSTLGQAVTFTAAVRAVAPAVAAPGGTVSFDDGATSLCEAVPVTGGEATCTAAGLGVGRHTVTATWSGDGELTGSAGAVAHDVQVAGAAVALSAAPSPARTGQVVTLTATVSAAGGAPGTPTGTVRFADGDAVLCDRAPLSDGAAACATSALAVGVHDLSAAYSGDRDFGGATGVAAPLRIQAGGVDVTLTASPAASVLGQPVTFTATVGAAAPAAGTPAGAVTFSADGAALCTSRPLAGGVATCATEALAAGPHAVTAAYVPGDDRFLPGEGGVAHEVGEAPGAVAVASSRNPSRAGRPVTFTASVHYEWMEPAGTVTFRSGQRVLGTAALSGGRASITVRDLTRGAHPVTAEFAGGGGLAAASGALPGDQVVENTPPVAGAGTALALGPDVPRAAGAVPPGALDAVRAAELWFRADEGTAAGATLLRLGGPDAPPLAVRLRAARAGLDVTVGATTLSAAAALGDGRWHHLAVSADGGTVDVLLDGAAAASAAGTLDATGAALVTLGDGLAGAVDEVRLWSAPRDGAAVAADLRRPVPAGAPALAALWRLDEGTGAEAFDAGPAGIDLAIEAQGGAAAFAPSAAWRDRAAAAGAPMAPVDAGYDADGDPLVLTLADEPDHGVAVADAEALQVGYTPSPHYAGVDGFTLRLDDGAATADAAVRVVVTGGDLVCHADADCGAGAACVRGACTPIDDLVGKGDRTGCASAGAPASLLAAALLLLLRRRPAPQRARARGVLLALAAATLAGPARAQTPAPIPVENFAPAPPGDPLFTTPAPEVPGHLAVAAGVALSYAREPLVLERDGERVDGGVLVQDQLWGFVQASVGLGGRVRVDGAIPVVLSQGGEKPFSDVGRVSRSSLGDLRLGGQLALGAVGPLRAAAGLDLWLPSGDRAAYATDGRLRGLPKLIAGGASGRWVYGAQLGVLLARRLDVGYAATGSGLAFSGGAAWRSGAFRVGPEVWGQVGLGGTRSPSELLLGAHWSPRPLELGLAVSHWIVRDPGAPPLRVVVTAAYR